MASFLKIESDPWPVEFAGFRSDTMTLQRQGWALSMEQEPRYNSLRLAMKHERGRLFALSSPVSWHAVRSLEAMHRGVRPEALTFNIIWMGSSAQFEIFPQRNALSFKAIDAMPELLTIERLNFEDAIPFRTVNPDAPEIIVSPSSVPELMDMILRLQDPKQKEIRDKARKEAWRRGGDGYERSEGYNPAADIKAQIITLAG